MTHLVTDLIKIKHLTEKYQDDFEVLGYMLQLHDQVSDEQIDTWVDTIAQPIIDAIDCTQCANCCQSLDVYLTEPDANRLADRVDISVNDIIDHESAQTVGEWGKFKSEPCQFLDDKLCSIYEHRPATCRTYPALTPDFRWTFKDTLAGASICPIIYNVLVALHKRINEIYRVG